MVKKVLTAVLLWAALASAGLLPAACKDAHNMAGAPPSPTDGGGGGGGY